MGSLKSSPSEGRAWKRVLPQSDHSSDIIRALERELKKAGAKIHLHTAVQEIVKKPVTESVTDSVNTLESKLH